MNNYEAEVVEDIPEQFDLSRYKKNRASSSSNHTSNLYKNGPSQPQSQSTHPLPTHAHHPHHHLFNAPTQTQNVYPALNNFEKSFTQNINTLAHPFIQYSPQYAHNYANHLPNHTSTLQRHSQHHQHQNFLTNNNGGVGYVQPQPQQLPQHHLQPYYVKTDYDSFVRENLKKNNASSARIIMENEYNSQRYSRDASTSSTVNIETSKTDGGRKKNSFGDEENENPFQKKEYFLKDRDASLSKDNYSRERNLNETEITKSSSKLDTIGSSVVSTTTTPATLPKSSLKSATKKSGVTFDEKLEVYEVKNPHYGLEIKSEKREIRKKRKDRQKEEEIAIKTKLEMKSNVQSKNMLHYYYYEKTLVYNTLIFYEENVYRASIVKLQDKLRNSKPDEKLRDQLLQLIEKDNQSTVDIIKYVKKDFHNKLEPFCNQYQTTVEKLHSIPGMYQVMQTAANSVNFTEIVKYFSHNHKDTNSSPSTLRKILGHENKSEKFSNNFSNATIKPPLQRKADLWLPKNVIAAIDMHVKDSCYGTFKNITELIFKLSEICENDLHILRAIYKYVLITQLEGFRRNESGSLIMRNFDIGIESTNTIFGRLCSFAGIENRFVRGLWKTICQEPGEKVEAKCVWNIVNLESGWRFIQPAFTPIKLFSRTDNIIYEETEFYFLSDPDALYYEFLPNDKTWLFNNNENTVDSKNFTLKPIITPYFRTLNLFVTNLSNHPSGNLEKEPFKLAIRYPQEYSDIINFKYTLKQQINFSKGNNSISNNENTNTSLNLYVISELFSDKNEIVFKISSMPEIGNFNLTIYASLATNDDTMGSSASLVVSPSPKFVSSSSSTHFDDAKAVISMRIHCSKLTHFEIPPNRIQEINVFGMNNIMQRLGLIATDFKQGILGTDREGRVNLVFEMQQPLDIEAYLYSTDPSISTKCLELCMLKRVVHNFLIFIINPPHSGLYGLDLHGAVKGTFSSLLHSQLPPIGKFLIKSHHQIRSFYQFPKGDNRDWGPKQIFYDLGLHCVGNMDPYIVNEDGKQIEIEIAMLKSVTMWYKFDYDQNGTPKAIDNFCFMNYKNTNKKERTVSFLLRFPYRGFYHLAVMATDDVFPSKPDEIVYNYLIRVQDPSNEVESFPIILNPILWKDCCLIAPKNFRLNNYDVHFSVIVPKTNEVQVTTGEFVLDKLEPREIENSWVGLVTLNDNSKFVYIEAEYENKFKKLIRFKGITFHNHS